jgi:hypothetical protein
VEGLAVWFPVETFHDAPPCRIIRRMSSSTERT